MSPSTTDLVHSTDVWYKDGTLVIQTESTLFRVYHGLLASQSTVFNDTLSLPQPSDAPIYDGCPLIYLDDSAEDMKYFLKAIHEWNFIDSNLDITAAGAILRLSTKYCVDNLRERSAVLFRQRYNPSTMQEYFGRPETSELAKYEHITAVNIGRHYGLPEILPIAFYEAATTLKPREMFMGVLSPSGALVTFTDSNDADICANGKTSLGLSIDPNACWAIGVYTAQCVHRQC